MKTLSLMEEPNKQTYIDLINYACDNNNIIMFDVIRYDANKREKDRNFKIFCELLNKNKEDIMEIYNNEEFLEDAYTKIKDAKGMIWENGLTQLKEILLNEGEDLKDFNIIREETIRRTIKEIIFEEVENVIFERNLKELMEKIQEDFIKIDYQERTFEEMITCDKYFYNISDKIREILLEQDGLYSMKFPKCLENITFFNNDSCWLRVISHEELCYIYPHNEAEIKYLYNIGLRFE